MVTPELNAVLAQNLAENLAEDLAQLIRLHDQELDGPTLAALQETAFPEGLALLPLLPDRGAGAVQLLDAALAAPPSLDELAADYAAIYLTGAHGASPMESVWVTDEHLTAGPPMLAWREILKEAGLAVAQRQQRYDDHLVCQLAWLARALRLPGFPPARLARILDEHTLYWLPDWAGRVQARADTAFYAGLAGLTLAWLEALRGLLAELHDLPRPDQAQVAEWWQQSRALANAEVAPLKFVPGGSAPGW